MPPLPAQPFAVRGVYHGDPIEADDLPPYLAKAVVAIEDRRFYEHRGIDLRGIARAAFNNVSGSEVEGGSTITQQFARIRYLSPERSLRRKVQEAMIAVWLETAAEQGRDPRPLFEFASISAPARSARMPRRERYFGKPVKELDLAQSAMLAGLIRAPSASGAEPKSESRGAPGAGGAPGDARQRRDRPERNTTRRAPSRSLSWSRPSPSPARTIFSMPPTPR